MSHVSGGLKPPQMEHCFHAIGVGGEGRCVNLCVRQSWPACPGSGALSLAQLRSLHGARSLRHDRAYSLYPAGTGARGRTGLPGRARMGRRSLARHARPDPHLAEYGRAPGRSWRCPAAARTAPSARDLLNGWTQRGDRPQFAIVTGASAGALIAPFAFLGSRYDDVLARRIFQRRLRGLSAIRRHQRIIRCRAYLPPDRCAN